MVLDTPISKTIFTVEWLYLGVLAKQKIVMGIYNLFFTKINKRYLKAFSKKNFRHMVNQITIVVCVISVLTTDSLIWKNANNNFRNELRRSTSHYANHMNRITCELL